MRLWGGGRSKSKTSFCLSSFHSAFRAFAQSFLFFVALYFSSTFQRTANVHLYQGASPSFLIFRFEWGTGPRAPVCVQIPTGRQHNVSNRISLAIVQRVFYMCAYGLRRHKTSERLFFILGSRAFRPQVLSVLLHNAQFGSMRYGVVGATLVVARD